MTTTATIAAELILDSSGFQKGLDKADKSASAFDVKMKNVGKSMMKVGGVMSAGLTLPLAAFGASSVQSAMDSENAMAELEAVIKSTGGAAGVSADEITKMASGLQKVTKFSDEAIINGQSMLLTFTNIGRDVFPQATETMLNMAEKFGGVDQAAMQLGKALNDPIAGVSALRRVGVQLTDAQEQQIKDFMAVNDLAGAQGVILKELETEFGGLAKAAGETTSGKFEQFKNQLDDVKETIGVALIPVLLRFLEAITPLIEKFAAASPQMQTMIIALAGIVAAAGPVITFIGGIVTAIGTLAPVFGTIVSVIGAVAGTISGILPIIALVAAAIGVLYLAWKTNFFGIRDTVAAVWEAIKLVFAAFKAAFHGDWRQFGELLRQAWDVIWSLIEKRIQAGWTFIVNIAKNIVSGVQAVFRIDWSKLGTNIIQGIVNGLKNGISWVRNAAMQVAQAAMNAVKGFLGIRSPSKVMFNFGEMTAKGFAEGMMARNDFSIPKALTAANTGAVAGAPMNNGSGSAGQNITINIENPKKETAEESIRRTLKSLSYTGVIAT